ncbi:MAG TPA: cation diffusion facilitator family transporter [Candidatus Baltobacteraceae bacterium]
MTHAARSTGLGLALVLTAGVAALELGGGIVARSLALLADSAHVFMDAVALGIALAAQWQATRPATQRQTFGFARLEILAALANGALLLAVTILIVIEAVRRLHTPELPSGGVMIVVAAIGASVNLAIGLRLARDAHADLNVKAALYHVAGDAVGGVAVVIGGAIVLWAGVTWIDPLLSLLVAALIVIGVIRIVREAADILLESTPAHVDMGALRRAMAAIEGVVGVHDLHVWTIGPHSHALSAHVLLEDKRISEATAILQQLDARLREDFDISHVTIQFECESCGVDDRIVCTQIP